MIVVGKNGSKKKLYAEEIIAMILLKMKSIAETYLGESCHSAVVSVPASFNNSQRRAVIDAGFIAGIEIKHSSVFSKSSFSATRSSTTRNHITGSPHITLFLFFMKSHVK